MEEQTKKKEEESEPQMSQEKLNSEKQIALQKRDYIEADKVMKKIKELELSISEKVKESEITSYNSNLRELEDEFNKEVDLFNKKWEEKEREVKESLNRKEKLLEEKHKGEIDELYIKFVESPNAKNYKPSPKYLNLKKSEEALVKQNRFLEANRVKILIENLVKDEVQKQKLTLNDKLNKTIEKLVEKHNLEKAGFEKSSFLQLDSLLKQKEFEYKNLKKRYENSKYVIQKEIRSLQSPSEITKLNRAS